MGSDNKIIEILDKECVLDNENWTFLNELIARGSQSIMYKFWGPLLKNMQLDAALKETVIEISRVENIVREMKHLEIMLEYAMGKITLSPSEEISMDAYDVLYNDAKASNQLLQSTLKNLEQVHIITENDYLLEHTNKDRLDFWTKEQKFGMEVALEQENKNKKSLLQTQKECKFEKLAEQIDASCGKEESMIQMYNCLDMKLQFAKEKAMLSPDEEKSEADNALYNDAKASNQLLLNKLKEVDITAKNERVKWALIDMQIEKEKFAEVLKLRKVKFEPVSKELLDILIHFVNILKTNNLLDHTYEDRLNFWTQKKKFDMEVALEEENKNSKELLQTHKECFDKQSGKIDLNYGLDEGMIQMYNYLNMELEYAKEKAMLSPDEEISEADDTLYNDAKASNQLLLNKLKEVDITAKNERVKRALIDMQIEKEKFAEVLKLRKVKFEPVSKELLDILIHFVNILKTNNLLDHTYVDRLNFWTREKKFDLDLALEQNNKNNKDLLQTHEKHEFEKTFARRDMIDEKETKWAACTTLSAATNHSYKVDVEQEVQTDITAFYSEFNMAHVSIGVQVKMINDANESIVILPEEDANYQTYILDDIGTHNLASSLESFDVVKIYEMNEKLQTCCNDDIVLAKPHFRIMLQESSYLCSQKVKCLANGLQIGEAFNEDALYDYLTGLYPGVNESSIAETLIYICVKGALEDCILLVFYRLCPFFESRGIDFKKIMMEILHLGLVTYKPDIKYPSLTMQDFCVPARLLYWICQYYKEESKLQYLVFDLLCQFKSKGVIVVFHFLKNCPPLLSRLQDDSSVTDLPVLVQCIVNCLINGRFEKKVKTKIRRFLKDMYCIQDKRSPEHIITYLVQLLKKGETEDVESGIFLVANIVEPKVYKYYILQELGKILVDYNLSPVADKAAQMAARLIGMIVTLLDDEDYVHSIVQTMKNLLESEATSDELKNCVVQAMFFLSRPPDVKYLFASLTPWTPEVSKLSEEICVSIKNWVDNNVLFNAPELTKEVLKKRSKGRKKKLSKK